MGRLMVNQRAAFDLRCGRAAIAHDQGDNYVVITATGARKLSDVAPDRLVFFVQDTTGISDPSEQFLVRDWEASLSSRRVK